MAVVLGWRIVDTAFHLRLGGPPDRALSPAVSSSGSVLIVKLSRCEAAGLDLPARIWGAQMKILACNSNRPLAEAIADYLGLPLTKASVRRFSDMQVFVEVLENVRGEDVFVIQSTRFPRTTI
jgi:N-terminal domain of ribose phosphate pyrophosphokinase